MTLPLRRIGIVADDFTGAMDSGAQFARSRLRVQLRIQGPPEDDVEIINTASREAAAGDAADRVRAACRALNGRQLFKKIDSTMRGHVAVEIHAALAASGLVKAVICPATPLQGRTVRDGMLFVRGIPLAETAFKDDPMYPAHTSRLDRLLGRPAVRLSLDVVRGSFNRLTASILHASTPLVTAEAETAHDLLALARAILATGALPCGAFGLAGSLLQAMDVPISEADTLALPRRALVVVGSANLTARQQVHRLTNHLQCQVWRLPASAQLDRTILNSITLSNEKPVVVVCADQDEIIRTPEWLNFGSSISRLAVDLLQSLEPEMVLVVGGETVAAFCDLAAVRSIRVLGEVLPGVPFGQVQGGKLHQKIIITMSGGFGYPDTLQKILFPEEGL
ncbi:MAG: four-carbon acid sugar kinase family protein [Chloroflexota bacterium]